MNKPIKPIPAFYACYLLRSTVRHQSLYVGSTPNPARRLRQHNGGAKGGAARTSKDSLRPWEMTCLVTGFPSKIAALQFEWAWQNTHLTRHVSPDSRLTQATTNTRVSPKTGRIRKRPARPRLCLTDRLANLHLLLRASSFERWPLKVTFYAEDVFRVWTKWTSQHVERLRPGIAVELDVSARPKEPAVDPTALKGIHAIDVTYAGMKPHLAKSKKLIEEAEWLHCAICKEGLPANGALSLVCPVESCSAVTHIECLSAAFLQHKAEAVVPTGGNCPECGTKLQWVDLVKEMSLRLRGEEEVKKLFRARRRRKGEPEVPETDADSVNSDDDVKMNDAGLPEDDEDGWHELPESSDVEDTAAIGSDRSPVSKVPKTSRFKRSAAPSDPEPVIEDSDWDEAEVIC